MCPPSEKEVVAILHDVLGFRQPTYACFMHICGPVMSRLTQSHSPIHSVCPTVRGALQALRVMLWPLDPGVVRDGSMLPRVPCRVIR